MTIVKVVAATRPAEPVALITPPLDSGPPSAAGPPVEIAFIVAFTVEGRSASVEGRLEASILSAMLFLTHSRRCCVLQQSQKLEV